MKTNNIRYLVFDIESVPDGKLIKKVKYPDEDIDEKTAIEKFQAEILELTNGNSNFIPVTFQLPIILAIAKVNEDYMIEEIVSLDEPHFRPKAISEMFWEGIEKNYKEASIVTFNGRGFDVALMEMMAFRYGLTAKRHFTDKFGSRYRFGTRHIDLQDVLSNYSAIRMTGGLNMLAKILGKPGKMNTKGDEVYDLYQQGKISEINDYCIHDVLDTYFVFLRSRVMVGALDIEKEQDIVYEAKKFLNNNKEKIPAFQEYLKNWGDWIPWPV